MYCFDNKYIKNSSTILAGVDEVGRGPLAGPVVAAAVVLDLNREIDELNDSKKLSEKKRELLYDVIIKECISYGIGIVHEGSIDKLNILNATKLAMKVAIEQLPVSPDIVLIDGNMKDITKFKSESIVKGDSKSASIAAASIVAKVSRDRMMHSYDLVYPGYDFCNNKGYGTKKHIDSLKIKYSCPIHRKSFNPVKDYMPSVKDIENSYGMKLLGMQIAASEIIKKGYQVLLFDKSGECPIFYTDWKYAYLSEVRFNYNGKDYSNSPIEKSLKNKLLEKIKKNLKKDISLRCIMNVISVSISKGEIISEVRNA